MKRHQYNILGVMSGTSLDGIDLAFIQFDYDVDRQWKFKILVADTIPYSQSWKGRLSQAISMNQMDIEKLDERYTVYLASVISGFIERNNLQHIDLICSHGHTIFHKPELGYTLQIGNLPILSDYVGHDVVCDFRVQDVLLGGQGAPLVPIGDRLLFSDFQACLNLGGFANVSFENNLKYRIAYDICPVNTVLNDLVKSLGKEYDCNGDIARQGSSNSDLLSELNSIDFYNQAPPKSLGVEFLKTYVNPIIKKYNHLSISDLLATYVEHIAEQIVKGIPLSEGERVLVTGGGAHNAFLLERIREKSPLVFEVPAKEIVDYKEAIIFGLLGVLKWRDDVNVLASVTGAKYDHSSGKVYRFFSQLE